MGALVQGDVIQTSIMINWTSCDPKIKDIGIGTEARGKRTVFKMHIVHNMTIKIEILLSPKLFLSATWDSISSPRVLHTDNH